MMALPWGGGWGGGDWGWGGKGKGKGGGGKGFKVRPENAASTVWIGGLAEGTEFKELQAHMNQAGTCKHAQITGKGTGFCWMSTPDEASNAIAMLNGTQLKGSTIIVDAWTKKDGK